MKAKAAVFMGAHKNFEVREFEVVPAPEGYAAMELIASGVCGTDLHFHTGRLAIEPPTVIGHEFVGRIFDISENDSEKFGLKKGDAVIADIAVPCGKCELCKSGDDANCVNMGLTNGGSIDEAPYLYGGYTEVNFTPLSNLIKIPDTVDPEVAAAFACPGPTAIHAFCLADKAGVNLADVRTAVVQGLGPVGMFAVLYLKKMGVEKVYAISGSKNEKRESLALKCGADRVFTLSEEGEDAVTGLLQSENNGLGVDLCFEASGAPEAVRQGMNILRNRGVYLIPGQYSNSGAVLIEPQIITFKALHIIGSSQYSVCDVKNYLKFLENNADIHSVIKEMCSGYEIADINKAFEDAKSGKNVKTVLVKKYE